MQYAKEPRVSHEDAGRNTALPHEERLADGKKDAQPAPTRNATSHGSQKPTVMEVTQLQSHGFTEVTEVMEVT